MFHIKLCKQVLLVSIKLFVASEEAACKLSPVMSLSLVLWVM